MVDGGGGGGSCGLDGRADTAHVVYIIEIGHMIDMVDDRDGAQMACVTGEGEVGMHGGISLLLNRMIDVGGK